METWKMLLCAGLIGLGSVDCVSEVRWYNTTSMTGSTLNADFEEGKYVTVSDTNSGEAISFSGAANPSVCDLDDDGLVDILVGAKGYVYLMKNSGNAGAGHFESPAKMTYSADKLFMKVGKFRTYAVCADMNGDGKLDIVVAGNIYFNHNKVIYYPNIGSARNQPAFAQPVVFLQNMPKEIDVRIDVADWNADGLLDIVVGRNEGRFAFYANTGSPTSPIFLEERVDIQPDSTAEPAPHPRVVDWDEDGNPDILYGSYYSGPGLQYVSIDNSGETYEESIHYVIDGEKFLLADKVGKKLSTDVADFNLDGIADLLVSGSRGKMVIFWGAPLLNKVNELIGIIDRILQDYPEDLGTVMAEDSSVSLGLQRAQDKLLEIANVPSSGYFKNDFFNKMASLVEKHPHYLKRRVFQSPYLVYFSGYMWTIMLECRADTVEHRTELAKVTNHTGPLYDTLVGSGILVIDNDASTEDANRMLRDYTASLRVEYFWVERISIQGCIGVIDSKQYHWSWLKKSSVNIFCKAENSGINKASLPGCRVCQTHGNILGNMHISVIAHELAHNSITNLGSVSSTEALRARKLTLMHRVLKDCPDIMWKENREVDKGATLDHFEAQGWLNADTDNFGVVIKRYFDGKWVPEAANYKYDIITNVNPGVVIVNSPNEYFASIAQCWAQDSKMLLDIAVERFLVGYKESINQILLLAEYYSVGGDTTRFWMHNKKGDVYSFDVDLERDVKGNIISMSVPKATERDPLDKGGAYLVHLDSPHVYEFAVDDDGFVVKIINFPSYIAAAN